MCKGTGQGNKQLGSIKLTTREILEESSEQRTGCVKYNLEQFHNPHYFNVVAGFFMELVKDNNGGSSLETDFGLSIAFYASVTNGTFTTKGEGDAGMF